MGSLCIFDTLLASVKTLTESISTLPVCVSCLTLLVLIALSCTRYVGRVDDVKAKGSNGLIGWLMDGLIDVCVFIQSTCVHI